MVFNNNCVREERIFSYGTIKDRLESSGNEQQCLVDPQVALIELLAGWGIRRTCTSSVVYGIYTSGGKVTLWERPIDVGSVSPTQCGRR